jgi:hypothetical protein
MLRRKLRSQLGCHFSQWAQPTDKKGLRFGVNPKVPIYARREENSRSVERSVSLLISSLRAASFSASPDNRLQFL